MNRRILSSLYKKEILDILRDKKTILMMIVVPLILYPLLFFGAMYLTSSMLNSDTERSYVIGFDRKAKEEGLQEYFRTEGPKHKYKLIFASDEVTDFDQDKSGFVDAYVTSGVSENRPYYTINYKASETASQTAAGIAEKLISEYRDELRDENFKALGLDGKIIMNPVGYCYKDHSSTEENAGYIIGYIVPFLMITSILMGALYPAIDATAGEKERGTLETLLTLPVKNLELITAKFLAVSTVAVAAAILNMISMSLMGAYFYTSMSLAGEAGDIKLISYLPAVLIMLLCVIVFAMFAAAVCLSACIFAKSFKEAQNYTTPVMLVFMIGGMAAMIPSLELSRNTALIPVVNITLLISSLFKLHFELSQIAVVLFSNIAYSILAIILMTRVFSSEQILFEDGSGSLRLLEGRKNMKKGQIPGIGDALLLLAVVLLCILFAGSLLIVKNGLIGVVAEQALIFAPTMLYAWYIKADMKKTFSLGRVKLKDVLGAFLCWNGSFFLIQVAGLIAQKLIPDVVAAQQNDVIGLWEGQPLWLIFVSSALMPAICEEWAFRGFLLGSLKHRYKKWTAIILCGIIFGVFHMSPFQIVLVSILGIVQSYVCYETGCIFLTMFMHLLNNTTSLIQAKYGEELLRAVPELGDQSLGSAAVTLIAGAVLLAGGVMLIRRKPEKPGGRT